MTQEFHISVTPIGAGEYLVRTERVAPGVPLAEEQVKWPVEEWLAQASVLMNDPLNGLLRGDAHALPTSLGASLGGGSDSSANLVALGQRLYNALFQGLIRDSWMTARGVAQHSRKVLRLRLGLKDTRLPRLPWEVLHAGDRPLATGTDIVFSRYYSSFTVVASLPQLQLNLGSETHQPLRILMVLAAPTDQEMLALKQEALHLQEELQNPSRHLGTTEFSKIELTILDQPGREQLTQALEHNHYHVFHYAGHSNLGEAGGNLYLVNSKTGLTEILSGDDLAGLLVNNGIRMAVFNSCRGVYTAASDLSKDSNLSEALVKQGIPAVLAMAERIPDDVALNLSRLFYRNLKQAYPIDLSLSRARQGLISSYGSNQLYWALPILYLHPQFDGYLQPLKTGEERPGIGLDDPALLTDPDELAEGMVAAAEELVISEADLLPEATLNLYDPDQFDADHFDQDHFEEDELPDDELPDDELPDDELPDIDDLEFDNPDYETDWETVAKMVNQLSQDDLSSVAGDRPLKAFPEETLLPDSKPPARVNYPLPPDLAGQTQIPATLPRSGSTSTAAPFEPETDRDTWDPEMYQELERLLSDAGKSTEEIAAFMRAIQHNPSDAEAYHNLGLVLFEQGYVAESIFAYKQALQINPLLAMVHNHLGMALFQQGNLSQAIQAYNRAIQLNPNLAEAYHNLGTALRRQGSIPRTGGQEPASSASAYQPRSPMEGMGSYGVHAVSPTENRPEPPYTPTPGYAAFQPTDSPGAVERRQPSWLGKTAQSPLLWAGVGAIGVTTLLFGIWFANNQFNTPRIPIISNSGKLDASGDLSQRSTAEVTAIAIDRLNQGDIPAGQRAVETLMDRGALTAAESALTPHLGKLGDNPTILFLAGRLNWQFVRQGDRSHSLDDARRYWEAAVSKSKTPPPEYHNALGFAYYAEGNKERAGQAWFRTLELLGEQSNKPTSAPSSKEALTAYAGMALVLVKSAENQPESKRANLLTEATKLRQKVLTDGALDFQPDTLGKNWMWSEAAIKDWRSLLERKTSP